MNRLYFAGILMVSLIINSCIPVDQDPIITSPIVLSNQQHHVGDNVGAEGISLYAEFEMPKSFWYATLEITFVYPDEDGTSGPDVETPPEITINGYKVGVYSSEFKIYPDCITEYDEFQCNITIVYDITNEVQTGNNEFRITSKAYGDSYDDFTFSDVLINFE